MIKNVLRKIPLLVKLKNEFKINYAYFQDCSMFKKNWIESKKNIRTVGYKIILDEHTLEKGLTSKNPRYFGINKINNIIDCINTYDKNKWFHDYAYNLGVSIINTYCEFYEHQNWIDRNEYIIAKKFLEGHKEINIKTGSNIIYKKDFINETKIDYYGFLNSRHSIRTYMPEKIKISDFEKAISMTSKTPTACNRQMCKIYYIYDEEKRKKVIKYGHGLTNFDLDTVNLFIVTFDISSLCCVGDRHQGWFNSGLVAMNFVNSLHSLGIGSCFIQFGNDFKEENELKDIVDIPSCEKVAVIISAGYYPDENIVPCSTRKNDDDIYKII